MSVTDTCAVCDLSVEATCTRCGELVCARHYDEPSGFCTSCAQETGGSPTPTGDEEWSDGVDTYRS